MGATAKDRSLFMKGFNLSTQGNYEDPTYLGFKIVFDFGGLPVDSYGQPPSPLFKDTNYTGDTNSFFAQNPFGQLEYDHFPSDSSIAYYSAQGYLEEREFDFNQSSTLSDGIGGIREGVILDRGLDFFNVDRNKLGGLADTLDSGRSGGKRSDMLKQFKTLLQNINKNSPWFFQSIEGLDELSSVARSDYNSEFTDTFNAQRTANKVLTFNCLESMNLRMSALADLYRISTFDAEYMRELLPKNLKYFKMFIFVSEIRNLNKTARLLGSAAAVKAVDDLSAYLGSNMNPGTTNALNKIQGGINKIYPGGSSPGGSFNSFVGNLTQQSGIQTEYDVLAAQSDQAGIKPVMMYECSQCEFDFDDSYPIESSLDVGTTSAEQATQAFRVHVGRVKVKNQYPNIRLDGLPLVLSDGWESNRSSVQKFPKLGEGIVGDLLGAGQDLLTNFVSGAIGDMITEGVANLTSQASGQPVQIFENVYNFSTSQDVLEGDNAYFSGSDPQESGFGGPPDRIYTQPEGDSYPDSPGSDLGVPDRVYPQPEGDVYPDSPGVDLGVPDRVYPGVNDDVYPDSPGVDLGVPDRVYPGVDDDVYPDSPGVDLGVPDRVYPQPEGDFYPDSPGVDLGVPDRVYPGVNDDVYPDSPGPDLGVPDRVYPGVNDDLYPTSPGPDLGLPDRVYPGVNDDLYPTSPGPDLGVPDRAYPKPNGDVYPDSPGADLGVPDRAYPKPNGDVYPDSPGADLGVPDRAYPKPNGDVYPDSPGADLGGAGRTYLKPGGDRDVYPTSPGADLGGTERTYLKPDGDRDVYPTSPGADLGVPDRAYPKPNGDVYPTSPGADLGVPDRVYPKFKEDIYGDVESNNNLNSPENVYNTPTLPENKTLSEDVYPDSPGADLGVPRRDYIGPEGDVYPNSPGSDLGVKRPNSNVIDGRSYEGPSDNVYGEQKMANGKETLGNVYPITNGDFNDTKEKEVKDIPNAKPHTKYDLSLGDNHPKDEKYNE